MILVRRAGLSPRLARFEARLGLACCVVMTAFLALCAAWLAADGPLAGGTALFHAGWINVASTAILALTLVAAVAAARTARRTLAARQCRRSYPRPSGDAAASPARPPPSAVSVADVPGSDIVQA